MFKAVLDADKIKRWIKIVSTIDELMEEACFKITPEEVIYRDVDSARISMINVSLGKDYFELYDFDGDSELLVCVQSEKLLKYSKALSKAEELTIEVEEGKFVLSSSKPIERKFILPASIEDREISKVPQVDFKASARIVVPTFRDILKESKTVGETITIHADNNELSFISKSEEGFQSIHKLRYPENVEVLEISVEESSVSIYPVDPLYKIVKEIASISGIVTLEFSTDYPLSLKFDMSEFEYYQFILAPRGEE